MSTELKLFENEHPILSTDMLGMKVVSATGRFLGTINGINPNSMNVCKRLFRVGPILTEKIITNDKIESIKENSVLLKPTESEYWQTPDKFEDFDPMPNFFALW